MNIVINVCNGGFGLAAEAKAKLSEYGGTQERNDPALVRVVEELGESAGDIYSRLKVIEIPDGVDWVIYDYDGDEWVAERHRTWK